MKLQWVKSLILGLILLEGTNGFGSRIIFGSSNDYDRIMMSTTNNDEVSTETTKKRKRDKVMAFLRKKGVIGARKDFTTAMGVDEGPVGKSGGMKVCANIYVKKEMISMLNNRSVFIIVLSVLNGKNCVWNYCNFDLVWFVCRLAGR